MTPPGRIVLITGCSSGFGFAMARDFADRGWKVLATLRSPDGRPETAALLGVPGVTVLPLDIADPSQRAAIAAELERRCPEGLDCLVNNAGHGTSGPLEELTEAQIERQIAVNLTGLVLLTRALLPALRRAKGRVINISSVLGYVGMPFMTVYCATKHAVSGFSEALRYELAPLGIQVCVIEPGRHFTRFGSSMEEAEPAAGSPYAERFAMARAQRARRAGGGPPPEAVSHRVVLLAEVDRMPARRRVGNDARMAHLMKTMLPDGLADRILMFAFARGPR